MESTLRTVLILVTVAVFGAVPACGSDDDAQAGFSGSSSAGRGGAAGTSNGGGTAGETSGGEPGAGGEPSASGGSADGGSGGSEAAAGSPGGGAPAGGAVGAGGSTAPGEDWFCTSVANGCNCAPNEGTTGQCESFSCCYTYPAFGSGVACACRDYEGDACDDQIADFEGTQVDHCPP